MKKIISILFLFAILLFPFMADEKDVAFDGQAALSYIKALAADEMMGRESGEPGGRMGEEYIASKFKEWGIEPAGDNDTYFQTFTIESRHVGKGANLEISTEQGKRGFYYRDDWRILGYSGSGNIHAEIVFVGYGIHAPEKGYDDFAGVNVKDKLVMFTNGVPEKLKEKLTEEAKIEKRIQTAKKQGALGALVFPWGQGTGGRFYVRLNKEVYDPNFVIVSIQDRVSNYIFEVLPTDLRVVFQDIEDKGEPQSFATGVKAAMEANASYDPKRETRNVLAKITGADKELKNEYVVIGAHMDHLGVHPDGFVYNGANDNASGTAVVMEIARIMQLSAKKPKRTVIFGLWAAEEKGLLGSYHYCDHATRPIEKTVIYINMDMVGHGNGELSFSGEYYGPEIWKLIEAKLPEDIKNNVTPRRGGPGGSDHTPFLNKGVPAFGAGTRGMHLKYHRIGDDTELIKPELLKKTGDLVHAAVMIMSTEPGDFIIPQRQALYHMKYQNLINHKVHTVEHIFEEHKDVSSSHVDAQLAVIQEKSDLSGDALRIDLVNQLLGLSKQFEEAKGLVAYRPNSISGITRQGKTAVVIGIKGLNSIQDNPQWAEVLAQQGAHFVFLDGVSELFNANDLSESGKAMIKCLDKSGITLIAKGANSDQAKSLLKASSKPLILFMPSVPDTEVMDLIKKNDGAIGLLVATDANLAEYFKQLDKAKETLGSKHLMIANEICLWHKPGKNQMVNLTAEVVKAKYDRSDFQNIYSGTFFRILDASRTSY